LSKTYLRVKLSLTTESPICDQLRLAMSKVWPPLQNLIVCRPEVACYQPGSTFGPNRLVWHTFVWIIEGGGVLQFDGRKVAGRPGTLLLGRPGMMLRCEWTRDCRTVHAYLHFGFRSPPRGWPRPAQWPLYHRLPEGDILRPLYRHLFAAASRREPLRASLLRACVELMLRSFVSGEWRTVPEPKSSLPPAVDKALAHIQERVIQSPVPPITLAEIAASAHTTKTSLCRLFQSALGQGPMECIRAARLGRAAHLLSTTNLSIKEIAETTGFVNPYHMSAKFRELYGRSPRAYRSAASAGTIVQINPLVQILNVKPPPRS